MVLEVGGAKFQLYQDNKGRSLRAFAVATLSLERLPAGSLWFLAQPPSGMLGIRFLNCLLSVSPNQRISPLKAGSG